MPEKDDKAVLIIGEEEYRLNQLRIDEARRYIDNWDAMNEQAKKEYDQMQADLQRKIREGEEARRMLKLMEEQQATRKHQLAIAGPSGQHAPQANNPYSQLAINQAPVTTARIEEVPQTNQPNPSRAIYNPSSSSHASTSAQAWQYPSHASQQQGYASSQWSVGNTNWKTYQPYQNRYPAQSQPGHSAAPGRQQYPTQSVPQQQYAPTQVQQPQQTQFQQGQSSRTQPTQGFSTSLQQRGPYSAAQAAVTHLPLRQDGVMFNRVQQQGNTHLTPQQPKAQVQHTTPQSTVKHPLSPYPPSGTVVTAEQRQQLERLNLERQQRLKSQANPPMANGAPQRPVPTPVPFAVPASSSLAGALGGTTKASTAVLSNAPNSSQPVSSSANAAAVQQQRGAPSNSQIVPTTAATSAAPPVTSAAPRVVPQSSPGGAASMARLKILIANWERDGPPQSYFELPGARVKIYKDKASKVYLVTPDDKGGYAYIGASGLDELLNTLSQDASKTKPTIYQDEAGNFQFLKGPLTPEQATKYRPYGEPLRQPLTPAVISLDEAQPPRPLNGQPSMTSVSPRTPKQADKTHLARDILRALTTKRPRPESESAASQETSTKRHASGPGVGSTTGSVVPNFVTRSSTPATFAHTSMQRRPLTSTVTPSHPSGSGPTFPPSHSQTTFHVHMQAPNVVPPSTAVFTSTTSANVLPPLAPPVDTKSSVPVSQLVTAPPVPSATQVPPAQTTTPSATTAVPGSSKLPTPQPSSVVSQPTPIARSNTKEKTPLFLPSPSSSPSLQPTHNSDVIDEIADLPRNIMSDTTTDPETTGLKGKSKKGTRRRQRCYVLVPPLPNYVKRFKAKQREYKEEDEIWNTSVPASEGFVTDEVQNEAVILSCSRLSKRTCKFGSCEAILNSTQALLDHISQEHRPVRTTTKRARCQWPQCGRQLHDSKGMFYHIRGHALIPLECAYEDCQESFRTPQQLVRHNESVHRNSSPKPSAALFAPELDPLPAAPKSLPSYMVESRQVQPPSISKDRHDMLGPWVLRNISGPVNIKTKRYNAAQPLRSQMERRPGNQPYDFMTYSSTNFSTTSSQPAKLHKLDDLNSVAVSEMTYDGMVLWQAPEEVKVEKPALAISLFQSPAKTDDLTSTPPNGLDQAPEARSPLFGGDNQSDEEAVENMLTE